MKRSDTDPAVNRRPPIARSRFTRPADVPPARFLAAVVAWGASVGYSATDLAVAARFLAATPTALACVVHGDGRVSEYAVTDAPAR